MHGPVAPGVVGARLRPHPVRAMPRPRLGRLLDEVWNHQVALVAGPAGSGKTTLLSQFASSGDTPTAWYRAEGDDAPAAVLAHLQAGLTRALDLDLPASGWPTVEEAAATLETWTGTRALLVIDDLHTLAGSPAERLLERFVDYAPGWLHVVAATRRAPSWNLTRMRVSGQLLEVGPEDLRFRSWEVERLFWDFYGERLPPEDVAQLTRDTDGWAAALQLLHLAIRGKPQPVQRRTVAALTTRSRLVREYLTRNVLDELPPALHEFLLATAVLGTLSGPLCDRLLDRTDSGRLLDELEARQLFISRVDQADTFRYHDILRLTLESLLVEREGEVRARTRFARAGELLEDAGLLNDALRAYCRAERWDAVGRLLRRGGDALAEDPGAWLDALPPWLVEEEPWALLATARQYLASGRPGSALTTYRRAETVFGRSPGAEISRREAAALAAWVDAEARPAPDWTGVLRRALSGEPRAAAEAARALPGPLGAFATGIALVLAGDVPAGVAQLAGVGDGPPVLLVGARLATAVAPAFLPGSPPLDQALPEADGDLQVLSPWLWHVVRAARSLTGDPAGTEAAGAIADQLERSGDVLGSAVVRYLRGQGQLAAGRHGVAAAELSAVARTFGAAGCRTMEAWARLGQATALHRRGDPAAAGVARAAERVAFEARLPEAASAAQRLLGHDRLTPPPPPAPLAVRCLGGFELRLGDEPLDLTALRPRARSTLRLLAAHAGRHLHRETITAALWPEADAAAAKRSLQVAVSSIRKALAAGGGGGDGWLQRDGDAYALVVPPDGEVDIITFQCSVHEGRRCALDGDPDGAVRALDRALRAYGGDLLPEEGPAEWVVERRGLLQVDAASAAQLLAELNLQRGEPAAAVQACERGLAAYRYDDALWRLLIRSREGCGDWAGATAGRRGYELVLAELGVATSASERGFR